MDVDTGVPVGVETLSGEHTIATDYVVTRNRDEAFIYCGVYGDVEGSTGPSIARIDTGMLEIIVGDWVFVQVNTGRSGCMGFVSGMRI